MDISSHEPAGRYEWIKFFKELSKAFLSYEKKQPELIDILNKAGVEKGFEDKEFRTGCLMRLHTLTALVEQKELSKDLLWLNK